MHRYLGKVSSRYAGFSTYPLYSHLLVRMSHMIITFKMAGPLVGLSLSF